MNSTVALVLCVLAIVLCMSALYFFWKSLRALLIRESSAGSTAVPQFDMEEELDNLVAQAQDLSFDFEEGKLSEEDFKESNKLLRARITRLMKERDQDLGPFRERAKQIIEQALLVIGFVILTLPAQAQDQAVLQRFFGEIDPLVQVQEAQSVPRGSVVVSVIDAAGKAKAGQEVRAGSLGKSGERQEFFCTTTENGICALQSLPTGEAQAFRLTTTFDGAKYASTPFRLSDANGSLALIQLRTATGDSRYVLQAFGALFFEYENNKAHVSQHAELVNMGDTVFVFPAEGLAFELPAGAEKFESEPSMSQILLQKQGNRVVLTGSLPPGRVVLDWAFELPRRAIADATFKFPFVSLEYDIATDYARGVQLTAKDFPAATMEEREDRVVLSTRRWTHPGATQAYDLHLQITGLAAHTSLKFILFGIACALLVFGLIVVMRKKLPSAQSPDVEQARIVSEARALRRQRDSGDIGPEFYAAQEQRLIDELAALLRTHQIASK